MELFGEFAEEVGDGGLVFWFSAMYDNAGCVA